MNYFLARSNYIFEPRYEKVDLCDVSDPVRYKPAFVQVPRDKLKLNLKLGYKIKLCRLVNDVRNVF